MNIFKEVTLWYFVRLGSNLHFWLFLNLKLRQSDVLDNVDTYVNDTGKKYNLRQINPRWQWHQ